MTELHQFAINLAREAGQLIMQERDKASLTLEFKGGKELVTSADLKADELICQRINSAYPDHSILSEESSPDLGQVEKFSEPLWIIDPIDGTVNFAHGHSQSAVSIAYVEQQQTQLGVVFNPFSNEMFSAKKGQ